MEHTLSKKSVSIAVWEQGAELRSLKYKGEEFMWNADPNFWGKTSPVLFPFIGGLKDDQYTFLGKTYPGKKHGFARDHKFQMVRRSHDTLSFVLKSSPETLQHYPFEFKFYINYQILEKGISILYKIVNLSKELMFFSLGAHPAFALPQKEEIGISDYYLEFESVEKASTFQIEGLLISREKTPVLNGKILDLSPNLFAKDAFIFEGLKSEQVTLKCRKTSREVSVDFAGFPYIAFWNVPGAGFLCIEPWCGINDFTDSQGILEEKPGIQALVPEEEFVAELTIGLKI